MKKFFILLGLVVLCSPSSGDDPPEMRAFYAATFHINTQAACDAVISKALTHNINAVFVEVRCRADAYYYPNREDSFYPNNEPRGEKYSITPGDLDALQYFIDALHTASPRVEVHAWCTTYNSWNASSPPSSGDHVYNDHPEWLTENKAGSTLTWESDAPLDPGIPAVQDHIYNVYMDIVRNYDVDGIHFDYIRLHASDSGYDPLAKVEFLDETGWNFDTQNPSGQLNEVYKAWRRDQISQLVQRVHTQTMLEKPWVESSAFLVNFADSVELLGQGYNWWVSHEAIDVLHPGCYSSTLSGTVADWNFFVSKLTQNGDQNKRPMVSAVGDYLLVGPDPNYSDDVVTSLRANARSADGFNFFSYGSLFSSGHDDRLFNPGGPMDDWAPVPSIAHKTDEETTAPNAPASLSASIVGTVPRVTFNRPSSAGDGDLPVHYRLYRDTSSPVDLTYDNMVMEWWD